MPFQIRAKDRWIVPLFSYKSFLIICLSCKCYRHKPRSVYWEGEFYDEENIKKTLVFGIGFLLCVSGSIGVSAEEVPPTAEEVFPEEEVEALQEEVNRLPVYQDNKTGEEFLPSIAGVGVSYLIRKGCILVTDDKCKGVIPTGHAAIIYSRNRVVESLENGVVVGANDWNISKKPAMDCLL